MIEDENTAEVKRKEKRKFWYLYSIGLFQILKGSVSNREGSEKVKNCSKIMLKEYSVIVTTSFYSMNQRI